MSYGIDSDDIGEYCKDCREPIYVGERVIEIVHAGKWFNGHTQTGQLVHFLCLSTGRGAEKGEWNES